MKRRKRRKTMGHPQESKNYINAALQSIHISSNATFPKHQTLLHKEMIVHKDIITVSCSCLKPQNFICIDSGTDTLLIYLSPNYTEKIARSMSLNKHLNISIYTTNVVLSQTNQSTSIWHCMQIIWLERLEVFKFVKSIFSININHTSNSV